VCFVNATAKAPIVIQPDEKDVLGVMPDVDNQPAVIDLFDVVTRGELIITVDGNTTRCGVGDWYQIPSNTEHAAAFEQETDEIEFWFKH